MSDVLETIEKGLFTAKIYQDDSAESPREWDNIGTLAIFHRDVDINESTYNSHDFGSFTEMRTQIMKDNGSLTVILPVYMLDHSGLWFRTGDFSDVDPGQWDSGQVGFIYIPEAKIAKEWGNLDAASIQCAIACCISEIEVLNQYVTGDVYGYVIEGADDSCWGFYGIEDVRREVNEQLDYYNKKASVKAKLACL